jgi:sulfoxide reductase heme-binding subunit YedZ
METQTAKRGAGALVLIILIPLALVAVVLTANPSDYMLHTAIRTAAMLGYMYVFFACLSSAFVQEMTRRFGRPYLKIHHTLATVGLTLLTIHGAAVAWDSQSIAVLLPRFQSPEGFLSWGGPPAYWLIWIAVAAAAARLSIGARWRVLHWLNYIAFMLATAHALMIGSDLEHAAPRWAATAMVLVVIAVFLRKRLIEANK